MRPFPDQFRADLRALVDGALRGSAADEHPHYSACIDLAHGVLAAALGPLWPVRAVPLLVLAYATLKEGRDALRGEPLVYAAIDAAMVALALALWATGASLATAAQALLAGAAVAFVIRAAWRARRPRCPE